MWKIETTSNQLWELYLNTFDFLRGGKWKKTNEDLYYQLCQKIFAWGEIVTSQPCLMGVRRQWRTGVCRNHGAKQVEKKHAGETWDSCSVSNLIGKAARVLPPMALVHQLLNKESWFFPLCTLCNDLHFVFSLIILLLLCIYFCTKKLKWKYIMVIVFKKSVLFMTSKSNESSVVFFILIDCKKLLHVCKGRIWGQMFSRNAGTRKV